MSNAPSCTTRDFALRVVRRLRDAGFQALWAGGCVRDYLLEREAEDYDVATSATPDEVRELFGRRHTIAVGAAFGVIIVRAPKGARQVEVATFRRDAAYSDGRHPDSVTFSSAKEDAQRRDFTINGLFYDPVDDRIIDYVGGRQDLHDRIVRAIGDPRERISEDKLRMLRTVRFAATFDFLIDAQTLSAVAECAPQITVVSAERIAEEMRKMLVLPARGRAVRLLVQTGLLPAILPETNRLSLPDRPSDELPADTTEMGSDAWRRVLSVLERLANPSFPQSLAAVLREIDPGDETKSAAVETVCRRWRLSVDEIKRTIYLVVNESRVRRASRQPWPKLQRLLITDGIDELLSFAEAVADVIDGNRDEIHFCREKLQLVPEKLNPDPLITGDDLIEHGMRPGKIFKSLLETVRDAQLLGEIQTRSQALDMSRRLWEQAQKGEGG